MTRIEHKTKNKLFPGHVPHTTHRGVYQLLCGQWAQQSGGGKDSGGVKRGFHRQEIIKRQRKKKSGGPKKFAICPKWEHYIYYNKENEKVFPNNC